MSTHSGPSPTAPTSVVRNTVGREKEISQENPDRPASDVTLREYGNKHYNQLLPILAEKMHQEKQSESGMPSRGRDLRKRLGPRNIRSLSGSPEARHGRSKSPRKKDLERKTVFKRMEKGVFHRLGDKEKDMFAYSNDSRHHSYYSSRRDTESCYQSSRSRGAEFAPKRTNSKRGSSCRTEVLSEEEDSVGGHWKTKSKRQKSSIEEDDMSQPWESIDSYDDLKKVFLKNYLQQKKCIKDPVEIHNIKQRDGESTEEFVRRYKLECRDVKGAPECMKISGFMHGITNPELIKRLHDKIPKSVDEMMREQQNSSGEAGHKQNFKKGGFQNKQRSERKQDMFTLLTKTPKEILALDKGKFKPPPSMTTLVEKRNASKFCEFHGEVGHTTDECMHLKMQIEEMLKVGKLSYLIKELKQNNGKNQAKAAKNGRPQEQTSR
ncbi:reverse transcriptase domain-containing protein [Tanacetum coccineum]